jgi:predicted aldo/keto reductase-like oxidoreductase
VIIPEILALYNEYYTKRGNMSAQQDIIDKYGEMIPPGKEAEMCARCGECEDKCPQQLPIRNFIRRAAEIFKRKR